MLLTGADRDWFWTVDEDGNGEVFWQNKEEAPQVLSSICIERSCKVPRAKQFVDL